jgi:hypothetical protein
MNDQSVKIKTFDNQKQERIVAISDVI